MLPIYWISTILVYSPPISGIVPDIYRSRRRRIYLNIDSGRRFSDGNVDADSSCIGTAVTIAYGIVKAVGTIEAMAGV